METEEDFEEAFRDIKTDFNNRLNDEEALDLLANINTMIELVSDPLDKLDLIQTRINLYKKLFT